MMEEVLVMLLVVLLFHSTVHCDMPWALHATLTNSTFFFNLKSKD